jgi:hypothetical protein
MPFAVQPCLPVEPQAVVQSEVTPGLHSTAPEPDELVVELEPLDDDVADEPPAFDEPPEPDELVVELEPLDDDVADELEPDDVVVDDEPDVVEEEPPVPSELTASLIQESAPAVQTAKRIGTPLRDRIGILPSPKGPVVGSLKSKERGSGLPRNGPNCQCLGNKEDPRPQDCAVGGQLVKERRRDQGSIWAFSLNPFGARFVTR